MAYEFKFDSETFTTNECCNQITVEVNVDARCDDDYSYDIESIFDETAQCERPLESFTATEQAMIEKKADELASENAYEAYHDYLCAKGDRDYDDWKDSQMEGE